MYEQFLFYWLIWIIFVIVMFFMRNGKQRSLLLFWILVLLFISDHRLYVGSIQISVSVFVLLIGTITFFVHHSFSIYKLMVTFSVMIGYISLLIWEKVTPIWFFMPSYFLIPVMVSIFTTFLVQLFYDQVTTVLVSISFGYVIFDMLLIVYHLNDVIGDNTLFIHISLTILFLSLYRFVHSASNKLDNALKKKVI